MAYEGFQLLAYDYGQMADPERILTRAVPLAILCTIVVYVGVALGTAMLIGAETIVDDKEVALAEAGRAALGQSGFIGVTVAAALSTASAINATLFATARLSRDVAQDGSLPALFGKADSEGVPYAAILIISVIAGAFALLGGLQNLVQGASFVFLGVFALVNWLSWRNITTARWQALAGMIGALLAALVLAVHLTGLI